MRQVALLLAIGRFKTLRRAAGELGLTQPAATKMLQELERALGTPLFERANRSLKLTKAGEITLEYFERFQGHFTSLTRALDGLTSGEGIKLRIGSIMAASPVILSRALIELKVKLPKLSVEIEVETSDHLTALLRNGHLDLVVGRIAASADDLTFLPIAKEELSLVVSPDHPLRQRKRLVWSDLLPFNWILQSQGSPMREVLEREFEGHNSQIPGNLVETSSILTTTNLLALSEMIAVIPSEVAEKYEAHGLLHCLPYKFKQQLSTYGVITARDRPMSVPTKELISILRTYPPASH
jgi:DNA-binding transcriptional LysR family regulator